MKKIYKTGKIRIISGYLKGQIINILNTQNIRPTTNRIRETLFNWISIKIKNSNCLDCFSGSGALGIEAISRYAKFVTLLELKKKNIDNLNKNIKRLKIHNIRIIHTNTLTWIKKNKIIYDIIFIDPPYYSKELQKIIFLLEKNNCIHEKGYIYIEKSIYHELIILPKNWYIFKQKKTNKISYTLYKIKNIIK